MNRKLCLTNPIDVYDEMPGLVDEGRAVNVVYLDFSKGLDTVSHKILIDELMKYKLDNWIVRWTDNWLNCRV